MKELRVQSTLSVPAQATGLDWQYQFVCFILTHLIRKGYGAIYAVWNEADNKARWVYSGDGRCIFRLPDENELLLEQNDILAFRSLLAKSGNFLIERTHFGAGYFKGGIKGESNLFRFAVLVVNSDVGFAFKVQLLEIVENE